MNPALWAAKTGLDAQQTRMAVVSNNLANVNTTAFKRGRAVFEDLLYQNVRQVGAQSSQDTQLPTGLYLGTGVRVVATEKLYTQGNISSTGKSLDMAVQGRGFFQILMPDGTSFVMPQHWMNVFIGLILIGAVIGDIWIRQENIIRRVFDRLRGSGDHS